MSQVFHKQIHTISSEKGGRNLGYSVPRSPLAKKLRQWCLVLSPIRTRDQLLLSFQAHTLHTLKTLCYNNRKWSKMAIHLEYLAKFFFFKYSSEHYPEITHSDTSKITPSSFSSQSREKKMGKERTSFLDHFLPQYNTVLIPENSSLRKGLFGLIV